MPKRIVSQCLMQRMPACRVAGLPGCHTQGIGRECRVAGLPGCRVAGLLRYVIPQGPLWHTLCRGSERVFTEYPSIEVVARIGVA